jgi:MFS family permease
LAAITIFALALGMTTNTLEPAVIGHKVLELVPQSKNTALGLATSAGLIVAVVWQPIIGVLSDRTRTRWGRRLPYFVGGTLLAVACLYAIALAPSFAIVVAGLLAIQLASNTVQGPWQALIPDHVPPEQRGTASGVKAAFDILAFVIGRQVSGQLVAEGNVVGAVSATAGTFFIALLLTAWAAKEGPEAVENLPPQAMGQTLARTFVVDWKAHPAFLWWFLNRFLFWAGFIALNTFLLFFMIDVVDMAESEAQRFVANLSLVIGSVLFVVALPSGWLADRLGRRPLVATSGLLAAAGTGMILVLRAPNAILAAAGVVGLGVGAFLSANWALVTDIVPEAEAARSLGIANIATAGGSFVARLLGGALIDPINRITASASAGYIGLFTLAILAFLLGTLAILRLPPTAEKVRPA